MRIKGWISIKSLTGRIYSVNIEHIVAYSDYRIVLDCGEIIETPITRVEIFMLIEDSLNGFKNNYENFK